MQSKFYWRKIIFAVLVFLLSLPVFAQTDADSQKALSTIQSAFHAVMGNESSSVGSITVSTTAGGEKEISAPVSMFGKGNLQLTGTFNAEYNTGNLKVTFPPAVAVNFTDLDNLTGGRLKTYMPAGFPTQAGVRVEYVSIKMTEKSPKPVQLATSFSNSRPFGIMGDGILIVDKASIELIVDNPKTPEQKITGNLSGALKLGGITTSLTTTLSTNKQDIEFKGAIENLTLKNLLQGAGAASIVNTMPASISSLGLHSLNFSVKPFQKIFSVVANSSFGEVELHMSPEKKSGGRMQFMIGIAPPSSFKFSSISTSLGLLDGINLSGTALVISDYGGQMESSLQALQNRKGPLPPLVVGLNVFTHINLGNELGRFLGQPDLDLYGSLDKSLNFNMAAALHFADLKLADDVYFKQVSFGLGFRPSRGKINFNLSGTIEAKIKGDLLSFNAGFDFSPTDVQLRSFFLMEALKKANAQVVYAKHDANMEVEPPEWNEPFGVKGFGLRHLGFSVGVSPKSPIFLSSLGITADARLGINPDFKKNISGSFTANLDIANPFNSMLDVNLQNITIIGLVDAFQPNAHISGTLRKWLDWGLENAYLQIIPESKTYKPNNKYYERGILAGGTLKLGGLSATAELKISDRSFGFKAMVDPINFSSGGFTWFALKGYEQGNKAQAKLQLNTSNPQLLIDGSITVLGVTAKTSINVSSKGAKFKVAGSIAGGTLGASLEVEAQQLSASGGFRVKAVFNNSLQDAVAKQLVDFIKKESAKSQAAYTNAQNSLQKAKNASNSATEKQFIDAANGFISTFKSIDKGMAVAGQYVAKGLIGNAINIRKIYFETNLNINQFTVVAKIDMTIAGNQMTQTATINLNISSITDMASKIVSQIKDVVVSAFESLGSTLEQGWDSFVSGANKFLNSAGKGIKVIGHEFEKAGAAAVNWVQGAAQTIYKWGDETFNGKKVPSPKAGSSPSMIPYYVTRYVVTITGIKVIKIPTTNLGLTTIKPDGDELEIFGSVTIIPKGRMWTNRNSNKFGFNKRQGDHLVIRNGSTKSVNISKYFYCNDNNRSSTGMYIYTHLYDDDGQNIFTAAFVQNEEMRRNVYISLAGIAPGQTKTGYITAYNRAGDHGVAVYYRVKALPKISYAQMLSAINSKNSQSLESLIRQGGDPFSANLMQTAIRNNDIACINVLGKYGVIISSQNMSTAIKYAPGMLGTLINLGGIPGRNELLAAVQSGNGNLINFILSKGVQPDAAIIYDAIKRKDKNTVKILVQRGILLGTKELTEAIKQNDVELINIVMNSGAVPSQAMLIQAIQTKQFTIAGALANRITPEHAALQEAANVNNSSLFKFLTSKGAVLTNNIPINKAIDNNNAEILQTGLSSGGNATEALQYAIQKNKKTLFQICLDHHADPTTAINYAVRNNDINFINQLLNQYKVNPNDCMKNAIDFGNLAAALAALRTQKVRSNGYVAMAAHKNNFDIVKALVENGGDPNLGMPAAVSNKNVSLADYLIKAGAIATPAAYLQQAIQKNDNNMITLLVRNGADVNVGMPMVIQNNNAVILKYLLDNGARPSGYMAKPAKEGKTNIIKLLLDKGANPNEGMRDAVSANQTAVVTMLLIAGANPQGFIQIPAAKNNYRMVSDLLKAGANPDPGMKPAVDGNYTEMVEMLLNNGASAKGYISKPAAIGNYQMVRMLLDKNANPNAGIEAALKGNHTNVIKLLIDRGANGNKFLAIPSAFGNLEIVKLLLDKGANPEWGIKAAIDKNKAAVTDVLIKAGADGSKKEYMYKAVKNRFAGLIPVLVNGGNKIDSTVVDVNGKTYLHIAADMDNSFATVKALLDAGAAVDTKDNKGETPLYLAVDEGKDDIETVQILLQKGADPCATNNEGKNVFKNAKKHKVKKLIKDFGGSRKCSD